MKKAYVCKISFSLLVLCCVCFFCACGLDVIKDIYADPVSDSNVPNNDSDFLHRSFEFSVQKLSNANNLGHTYVYYKIYNRNSTLTNEYNTLVGLLSDDTKKATSSTRMIDYGYKELKVKADGIASNDMESVTLSNGSHTVLIRLTKDAEGFDSRVDIDGAYAGVPCRTNGNSFNFFGIGDGNSATADFYKEPVSGDDDAKSLSSSPDAAKTYYVCLFSVFMNYDESYNPVYSPIHYLGQIKITD